jgi:hypothetical protein
MHKLADAFAAAGLCTEKDAELAGLTLSQLKARRDAVIRASLASQGSAYNRAKDGTFRSTTEEQAELTAINSAIRKLSPVKAKKA